MPDTPAVLGAGALPEYRGDQTVSGSFAFHDVQDQEIEEATRHGAAPVRGRFRTADDVFSYLSQHVVDEHLGSALTLADRWAVVTFLVAGQGLPVPEGGVGPANAGSIALPGRR